jgi:heme a synthase
VTVEGALGAGLVLKGWVADNASLGRAVMVALHLVNTLLLTASAVLTLDSARAPHRGGDSRRGKTATSSAWRVLESAAVLGSLAVVSALGAVTALGDTLLPAGSEQALAATGHFLVRLRIVHPLLALLASLAVGLSAGFAVRRAPAELARLGRWCIALTALQVCWGALNIGLNAPGALQLGHLALAQGLWLSAVVLHYRGFKTLARELQA